MKRGRKNTRASAGRSHDERYHDGIADMSDEEFRARCELTRPTIESLTTSRGGVLHGAFPDKASRKDMAPY